METQNRGVLAKVERVLVLARPARLDCSRSAQKVIFCQYSSRLTYKSRRSKRVIQHRRHLQVQAFVAQYRQAKFGKCDYCGSWKLPSRACINCFNFLRDKATKDAAIE
jgi:ribosomal protein L32